MATPEWFYLVENKGLHSYHSALIQELVLVKGGGALLRGFTVLVFICLHNISGDSGVLKCRRGSHWAALCQLS